MQMSRTRGTGWVLAVLLTTGLAAPIGAAPASAKGASVAPAKLVGRWTRKVTSADVKRAEASGIPAGSICTLTVKKGGILNTSVFCTKGVGVLDGNITAAGVNRVHIDLGGNPGVYEWRVSGRLLTFTEISDPVQDRAAVFWGVWKRK